MRISDWSSDVCSSDLLERLVRRPPQRSNEMKHSIRGTVGSDGAANAFLVTNMDEGTSSIQVQVAVDAIVPTSHAQAVNERWEQISALRWEFANRLRELRSEEHTSELQSLMRIAYAVFCLKKN